MPPPPTGYKKQSDAIGNPRNHFYSFPELFLSPPETLDPVFIGAITAGHLEAVRVSLKLRINK
jgi:hypothetical protein